VWSALAPFWRAKGLKAAVEACRRWQRDLDGGMQLIDLLPSDHLILVFGMVPLLTAAMAKHHVVLSPCNFIRLGYIFDLPGTLAVGVRLNRRHVFGRTRAGSRIVTRLASILSNFNRVQVLTLLVDSAASPRELASRLRLPTQAVQAQVKQLRGAGLIQPDHRAPGRYRASPVAVDALLNRISTLVLHSYGRGARLESSLLASEANFRVIFDKSPIGILQFDLEGRCLSLNPAGQALFGYDEGELGQLRTIHLLDETADADVFELFDRVGGEGSHREVRMRRKDGTVFWGSVTVALVRRQTGSPLFGYAMIESLGERQAIEDAVTGLPNRAVFVDRLERALRSGQREDRPVAVLVIDLDGFKQVNDALGHDGGDVLLRSVSLRMTDALRKSDTIGRLGGDEFAVLPVGASNRTAAARVAEKILAAMDRPFIVHDQNIEVGLSIGIALSSRGERLDDLMRRADTMMYKAKRGRKGYLIHPQPYDSPGRTPGSAESSTSGGIDRVTGAHRRSKLAPKRFD
jgi:diguanylate cyclase (GGDEF)-like protein/PAS domain S-box-containing protein